MQPLISVIIPIYLVEDYMDKCVKSIIDQTYTNLEILLVVGDAGDQCLAKSYEWQKKDKRITVIERPCNGLSDARNAGLDVMTGAYVAFIDSDDYVEEHYLEKLYRAMTEHHATSAICGLVVVDEHGKITEELSATEGSTAPANPPEGHAKATGSASEAAEVYTGRQIILREIQGNWCLVTAWGALFEKEIFQELRFPFKRRNEDDFMLHRIYDGQERVACVPENMYYYLQRSDSLMGAGYSKKDCTDYLDMWHERIAYYHDADRREMLPAVIQSALAWNTLYMAVHGAQMGKEEQNACKSDIRTYFRWIFRKPYLHDFTFSVKLAVKCIMTLGGLGRKKGK
jgi:glycosyltransferase involved in cell wall biosynthesis